MNILPSRKDFHRLAEKGNLIPVYAEVVADMETPVSAYYKLTRGNDGNGYSFMLESVEGEENIGRYSILGTNPQSIFVQHGKKGELITDGKATQIDGCDVFERVKKVLEKYEPVAVPGLPPFVGGAVGYAGYEVISEVEPTVVSPEANPIGTPEALFMITDSLLIFDKVLHTLKIISQAFVTDKSEKALNDAYDKAVQRIKEHENKIRQPISFMPVDTENKSPDIKVSSNKSPEEYMSMVEKAKNYIVEGDIFQVVLSQRFCVETPCSPLAIYRSLRTVNPSPYMFLLNCKDFAIIGASPEVQAKCENRKITVRPIAGTRKRGKTEEEDFANEQDLINDPKERAEHIMLVDLGRNDVGRVAKTGTVRVDELMVVERYSHVMHIVSNVTGELDNKFDSDAVIRSSFPAGTLSGAPKVRAMQIISELEKEKRGPYGGSVAYYSFNGNINSCITIRTAVLKDGKAYFQSGAGIVADSDPKAEYEETCNKAKAMLRALELAKIFNTSIE